MSKLIKLIIGFLFIYFGFSYNYTYSIPQKSNCNLLSENETELYVKQVLHPHWPTSLNQTKVKTVAGLQLYLYAPCNEYPVKQFDFDPIYVYIIIKNVSKHKYIDISSVIDFEFDGSYSSYFILEVDKNNSGFKKQKSIFYINRNNKTKSRRILKNIKKNEVDPRIKNKDIYPLFSILLRPGEYKIFVKDLRYRYSVFSDSKASTFKIKAKYGVSGHPPNEYGTEHFNGVLESNEISFRTINIKNRNHPFRLKTIDKFKHFLMDLNLQYDYLI